MVTPSPDHGIDCGPWVRLTTESGQQSSPAKFDYNADGCPNAEVYSFCQRWGCPKGLKFAQNSFAVEVLRVEGKNITAKATKLNGKSQTGTCGRSVYTVKKFDGSAVTR